MSANIKYRPDIDGLRGIAVLMVVLYHFEKIFFNSSIFQGGYIGVDIFFVISGYLISSIIFKKKKKKKNFSFINFYIRRVKRILPVLLVVILFCIIISSTLFIPEKFDYTLKAAASSWFFFSNIFFWKSGQIYNFEDSVNIPLLHTWSLSVEEQFYIFFPLFIFLIFKFLKDKILIIISISLILSLVLSIVTSMYFPNASFYLLPSRMWELLSGSIIAYYEIYKNKKFYLNRANKFLVLLGVILTLLFVVFAHDKIYHPSLITVIPIASTVLLICFCREKNLFIGKVLSSKYLVYMGLISYSLYLWHYPLFVFLKNLNLQLIHLAYIKYLTLILSIIFSILTYIFIEKPLRKKSYNFNYLLIAIIFFSTVIIFLNNKGISKLIPKFAMSEKITEQIALSKKNIICVENLGYDRFCTLGKRNDVNQIDIVLLGDSILGPLANNLNENLSNDLFRVVHLAKGGSFYTPYGKYINTKNAFSREDEKIDIKRTFFLEQTKNKKIIIIGNKYRQHLKDFTYIYVNDLKKKINPTQLFFLKNKFFKKGIEDAKIDFKSMVYNLAKDNAVILIYPFPENSEDVIQSLHVKSVLESKFNLKNKSLDVELDNFISENNDIINIFNMLDHKNLYKIYPQDLFCREDLKKCIFQKDGVPLYSDKVHLTNAGAKIVNNEIIKLILDIKNKK